MIPTKLKQLTSLTPRDVTELAPSQQLRPLQSLLGFLGHQHGPQQKDVHPVEKPESSPMPISIPFNTHNIDIPNIN